MIVAAWPPIATVPTQLLELTVKRMTRTGYFGSKRPSKRCDVREERATCKEQISASTAINMGNELCGAPAEVTSVKAEPPADVTSVNADPAVCTKNQCWC